MYYKNEKKRRGKNSVYNLLDKPFFILKSEIIKKIPSPDLIGFGTRYYFVFPGDCQ